jgi:hypothetical protein
MGDDFREVLAQVAAMRAQQERERRRELLSLAAAAELLHVAPATLSRWALRGRVPHVLTPGGHKRFPAAAIRAMAAAQDAPLAIIPPKVRAS